MSPKTGLKRRLQTTVYPYPLRLENCPSTLPRHCKWPLTPRTGFPSTTRPADRLCTRLYRRAGYGSTGNRSAIGRVRCDRPGTRFRRTRVPAPALSSSFARSAPATRWLWYGLTKAGIRANRPRRRHMAPQRMFSFQVLGAVAQSNARSFQNETSKCRGVAQRPETSSLLRQILDHLEQMADRARQTFWRPIEGPLLEHIVRCRPMCDPAAGAERSEAIGSPRPGCDRLRRAVKWMVAQRMADPALLKKSPPRLPEDRLMTLVAGIHSSNPDLALREIVGLLERLHERTPRGAPNGLLLRSRT